jgi:hypothetical protein
MNAFLYWARLKVAPLGMLSVGRNLATGKRMLHSSNRGKSRKVGTGVGSVSSGSTRARSTGSARKNAASTRGNKNVNNYEGCQKQKLAPQCGVGYGLAQLPLRSAQTHSLRGKTAIRWMASLRRFSLGRNSARQAYPPRPTCTDRPLATVLEPKKSDPSRLAWPRKAFGLGVPPSQKL